MGLHKTAHGGNWMLQQMGAWKYKNGNVKGFARKVVQEHIVFLARITYKRRACNHGNEVFLV